MGKFPCSFRRHGLLLVGLFWEAVEPLENGALLKEVVH